MADRRPLPWHRYACALLVLGTIPLNAIAQASPTNGHLSQSRSPLLALLDEEPGTGAPSVSLSRRVSPALRDEIWRSLAGHPAPTPEVLRALAAAALATGIDLGVLMAAAWKESAFRPGAAAPNSSARGLFQFTTATWREALARHGPRHGLPSPERRGTDQASISQLRHDPVAASLIAAEAIRADGATLSARLGRPITQAEAFLTHFLGLAGAERFLMAVQRSPGRDVRDVIPSAFVNNRARFPQGRGTITVRASYDHLIAIIESRRTLYLQLLRLERMIEPREVAEARSP